MDMSKENLEKLKEEIFNENISLEEKEDIINKIKEEVDSILIKLEDESEPIDE